MPRSLANSLYERLLRSFPADRAYTQADWDEDAMPAPVRHFLVQLLRHHSTREARRLRRARTEWVDYDHPEVEQAVRTFFAAVEAHTQVPRDQWADTLHRSTHHTTAHLVRPVSILTDFVFGEQTEPLRVRQVQWRMKFFGPYAYLRDAIQAFANKQGLDVLKPNQFERVLQRVDERITADFDADRWLRLLDALFNVAHRATGQKQVEIRLLRAFFHEKAASSIVQRLTAYEQDGHDVVDPTALHRLIEEAKARPSSSSTPSTAPSAPSPSPAAPRDSTEPPEPPSSPDFPPEPKTTAPTEDDIWGVAGSARPASSESDASAPTEESNNGETPLWKQFQQGRAESRTEDADASPTDNGQKPLWAQFRRDRSASASSSPSGEPASVSEEKPSYFSEETSSVSLDSQTDLSTLEQEVLGTSNPPHRAVYIRQLFGGDESDYRRVLERLRSTENWGEASQILASDVFRAHKVNIYSDAAVHFTNAIESRFRG